MSQARLASAQFSFDPANKRITFAGVPGFVPEGVVDVFHVPSGQTLYSPYTIETAGSFVGNALTLAVDTTAGYGAGKTYASADVLLVTYNDLARDDRLIPYAPRATGPLGAVAVGSAQSAVLDVQSATSISGTFEGSVDGTQWKAIKGQLPNLDNNTGDTNWNQGTPFNMRQYDVTPYAWVRINVTGYSTGTPTLNLLLKSVPATPRLFVANGGSLIANFDSGGSVGYVRTTNSYTDRWRQQILAGVIFTGSSRQSFGWPNPYYPRFEAIVVTDQPGTIMFQISDDNANWVTLKTTPVPGNGYFTDFVRCCAQWHRVVYTNGATDTGATALTIKTAFTVG